MRKLFYTLLAIASMPTFVAAQKHSENSVDSLVTDFISQLKGQGFERIGFAKHYCVGYNRIWKEGQQCDFSDNYFQVYIFWEDSSASFVKKYDNCGAYTMVQMSASPFFDAFEDNAGTIASEELAPFEFARNVNGKAETGTVTSDHSCHRDLMITLSGQRVEKQMDMHNLKKKDGDKENVHYGDNKSLSLVEWESRTSKFIWKVEKKGGFHREYPDADVTEAAQVD
jgi:hypothetical protein